MNIEIDATDIRSASIDSIKRMLTLKLDDLTLRMKKEDAEYICEVLENELHDKTFGDLQAEFENKVQELKDDIEQRDNKIHTLRLFGRD